jgi:hypothetical protein
MHVCAGIALSGLLCLLQPGQAAVSLKGSARSTTVSMPALHCIKKGRKKEKFIIIVSMHYNICNLKRGWVLTSGIVKALVLCTSGS